MHLKKILVVDDSEADQFLVSLAINEYDPAIEILTASDGQQALNLLNEPAEPPQLILLDINMPVMNGFEFLEHYDKRHDKHTVVVMLTSSDQESDKQLSASYESVKQYLIKPIEASDIESIDKLLTSEQ